ncbi:MAG: PLP-dependent aminotransferase family protein [Acidimicrobiales bacterium]
MTAPTLLQQLSSDDRWTSSVIRDLLVHARQPGVLSLAGGLPAVELLPIERCQVAADRLFAERGGVALQYGLTSGEPELRELLVRGDAPDVDRILVTAGSQQALDLVTRLAASPTETSTVVIEDPGYIGASQVFRSHGHQLVGIGVDADGLRVDELADHLAAGLRPRLCYVNPTFQNPTGATLSAERAQRLVELAETYDFLVVADDPYVELALDDRPAATPLPESPQVIRLGSMSKTLSPGLRIGWIDADPRLVAQLALVKQAADLHTSTFNQLLVADVMSDSTWWSAHLDGLRNGYRQRRAALRSAVDRHLPNAQVTPQGGGFFLWCDLGVDVDTLLPAALDHGVAFVPGAAFAIDQPANTSIRLSYSSGDQTQYDEAVRRLAAALAATTS